VASIPNLAHMNSRIMFFIRGNFCRTDCEENHPGERPIREKYQTFATEIQYREDYRDYPHCSHNLQSRYLQETKSVFMVA